MDQGSAVEPFYVTMLGSIFSEFHAELKNNLFWDLCIQEAVGSI